MAGLLKPTTLTAILFLSISHVSNALTIAERATLTPAANSSLHTNWSYVGCWTDPGNPRSLPSSTYTNTTGMTGEACVAYCDDLNYNYAGTEYAQECWCGNAIGKSAVQNADGNCSMACTGNSSEACGAGNYLSVYFSNQPPSAPPTPQGWNALGCYSDNVNGNRGLVNGVNVVGGTNNMTVENCISACNASGYSIAGLEYAGECWCDNKFENQMAPVTDGRCNMQCKGNTREICGGPNGLTVFQFNGWFPQGCWADNVNGQRVLGYGANVVGGTNNMTNENCVAACGAAGYSIAGTEYAGECFCGNSVTNGGVPATDGRCNMLCKGNSAETCGGPNGLTLFQFNNSNLAVPPTTTSTSTSTSTTPTSTATGNGGGGAAAPTTSTTSTAAPTPTSGVNSTAILPFKYAGCYTDNAQAGRALGHGPPDSNSNTVESCIAYCSANGYTIAGMEYSSQCFCDTYIRNNPSLVSDTQCNMACSGNSHEMCGAGNRLSIYSNGTLANWTAPAPQTSNLPSGWNYQGCLSDAGNTRSLPYLIEFPNNNTNQDCISLCDKFGYNAAGTEYGLQCFCGDIQNTIDAGATALPASSCNDVCSNDTSLTTGGYLCGGGNALSFYTYNGSTPKYNWNFATGSDAGAYQFLIGGVVIPLVTSPARNGKITFLEKSGTGPPNSTGAYELDLAQLGNFSAAWRPMHVKTDIFCSASLTLPDKAGRQINVGGWSGVSTEGIRLYWPDGSPGVWGQNDWQENPNEVQLQVGRWYPSAMILANGSVLVMGGEEGSNGAPVPSLEVLPPTGPVQFCDYLNRTDPYNLYPFLSVMPSGNVFVAYYNEARLLDPVSLQTKTVLPMIPGAVNRPDSGRTYPLEGTAVILPQHAPYTDPVTVLVCGGSNPGAAVALDNCVSIQPDAPNATWALERMPSKRVIPCMCALPDGTYLINNGAYQGTAGFGLAVGPNLNAVLYDPRKPLGSRMTVMANTTVARLYHSESVLLDDGRVLVSGSDPEDGKNPQEYRNEVFIPPYLLKGAPRPAFNISAIDFAYGQSLPFTITQPGSGGTYSVSFMGAVSSTHGNSMGQRTFFPAVTCSGTSCSVTAPPNANVCPPGWFQMFVLDANNIPSNATWVRIGGDPGSIGNWPQFPDFNVPGVGPATKLY